MTFRICDNEGFQLTFENGWTVSVQFGPMHYCDNRKDFGIAEAIKNRGAKPAVSKTAEVAVINPAGDLIELTEHDTVKGWVSADEVAKLIHDTSLR